ncbi:hypothetical protein COP2_021338 [Malus domestica]
MLVQTKSFVPCSLDSCGRGEFGAVCSFNSCRQGAFGAVLQFQLVQAMSVLPCSFRLMQARSLVSYNLGSCGQGALVRAV